MRQQSYRTLRALKRARKGVLKMQKLEREAKELGLEPSYADGQLDTILGDLVSKFKTVSYHRSAWVSRLLGVPFVRILEIALDITSGFLAAVQVPLDPLRVTRGDSAHTPLLTLRSAGHRFFSKIALEHPLLKSQVRA